MDVWRDDDPAVKVVFPLPVLAEGLDPRAGHLAGPHETWVGISAADVSDRLFRLASGAGRFSLGEAADAAGAPTTLLLVPRALAGNVPGIVFGQSEIYTWLKFAAVDEDLGSGLEKCPLSRRPCAPAPPRPSTALGCAPR